MADNKIATFDFTLKASAISGAEDYSSADTENLILWLERIAKSWAFQFEEGDSGYQHFQGRFTLKSRQRLSTVKSSCPWNAIHLSITSNENKGNNFYVTDPLKCLMGPWTDVDRHTEENDRPGFVPRQVREIIDAGFRPWQNKVAELMDIWDTRSIHVIFDQGGNKGKSVFSLAMAVAKKATLIPFCNDYKDILRMVCDKPKTGCYFIDLPRAIKKDKLFQMYAAIETVKSGHAFDDRYKFKESFFDSPNIFVFTNTLPQLSLLSQDRWRFWTISDEFDLIKLSPSEIKALSKKLKVSDDDDL